jgi:hypothetical protein
MTRSSQRKILEALNPSPLEHNNHSNWNNPTRTRLRHLLDERNNSTANATANATAILPEARLTDLPPHRERLPYAENMQTLEGDTFQVSSDDKLLLDDILNKMIDEWNMTLTTDCAHLGSNVYNNSECNNKDDNYLISSLSIDNCGDNPVSDNFSTLNFTQSIDDACAFPPQDMDVRAVMIAIAAFFLVMLVIAPVSCLLIDKYQRRENRFASPPPADDDYHGAPLLGEPVSDNENDEKKAETRSSGLGKR